MNGSVEIWRPEVSPDADGPGATTTNRIVIQVVDGEMTSPDLDPGPAKVMLRFGIWRPPKNIVIPDEPTPVRLTPLFSQYEPQPPGVVSEAWQAANAAETAASTAAAKAAEAAQSAADAAESAADAAAGGVPATRSVSGAGGLTGGGDLSQNRVISIAPNGVTNDHVADGGLSQSKLSATGAITDALNARERAANKGNANGYAALDESGKVPASQLPSYVDDVLEFASTGAFPGTGETGKIYIALDSNKVYRWGGSSFTEISPSPGSTDAVPEGSTNRYYTDARAQAANASAIAAKADDSAVVHLVGTETISGAKTFASSPTVPAPTANGHAVRKQDVDAKVGSDGTVITLVKMTQAQYDALGSGRPSTTWYGIVG
ncbi:phage upper tail fiber protein [Nocardia wallacei]|uniref:phage upper tail fiber protein n=1 Tax=Nocardia wallacei TaxID=480035 RepID=UPI002453B25A|nr:hypothetical protein [Nocardia wallacei]